MGCQRGGERGREGDRKKRREVSDRFVKNLKPSASVHKPAKKQKNSTNIS